MKKRKVKAASTKAGKFIEVEMTALNKGKSRAKSRRQAIAIGLAKAKRAGVKVAPKAKHA